MEKRTIGNNAEASIANNVLTLVIDLSKELGPSRSGKTNLIASTNGNFALPDGAKVGINVYRRAKGHRNGSSKPRE
jgi:hypothetical protein